MKKRQSKARAKVRANRIRSVIRRIPYPAPESIRSVADIEAMINEMSRCAWRLTGAQIRNAMDEYDDSHEKEK